MKTATLNRVWPAARRACLDVRARGILMTIALILAAGSLFAGPTVTWLSGGPNTAGTSGNGYGSSDGDITSSAEYHTPCGLAIDSTGNHLFVADRDNNKIRWLVFDENWTYSIGFLDSNGRAITNIVNKPVGVALDGSGNLFVLNRGTGANGNVLKIGIDFPNRIINTLTTNLTRITNAGGIALDTVGNVYVTASNQVYRVGSSGISNVVATITNQGTSLQGLVFKHNGLLAACDAGNNGIWLINPTNNSYSMFAGFHGAGDFISSNNRDSSNSARFFQPTGIAEAGDGTLIVSDYGNHRVKAVLTSGIVTNLYGVTNGDWVLSSMGWPGFSDLDGGVVHTPDQPGGVSARLPNGLAYALDGTIYVAEDYYHIIRKVTGTGLALPPPRPPGAPTILTVTTNYGQATLTWTPVVGATNYYVKRSPSPGGPYTIKTSTTGTTYTDTTVIDGSTYYYVVSAVNTGGEGPNSTEVLVRIPLPPVPDPQIGYVDFPATSSPIAYTSVFHPVSSFVLNNDAYLVIVGTAGTTTYFTYGNTTNGIPDPTSSSGSAPVGYIDGLIPSVVAGYAIAQTLPDLTIKAIGEKNDGSPNSAIVQSRFQFVTANPVISGANAALFSISDLTINAHLYYTLDGSDPSSTNASAVDLGVLTGTNTSWPVSFTLSTNTLFKVRAFRNNYQPSGIVSNLFTSAAFQPNTITFGTAFGEPHSSFQARPGQFFYAPVTLQLVPGFNKMYSLQFNVTVTNGLVNPNTSLVPPAIQNGAGIDFFSMLMTQVQPSEGLYFPPSDGQWYLSLPALDGSQYSSTLFTNVSNNLLGVGWLYRTGIKYLNLLSNPLIDFDTTKQDLIAYSIAHDTLFTKGGGLVVVGAYSFQVPTNANYGDKYFIQLGSPSATSDGVGAPGSDIYIQAPVASQAVSVSSPAYLVGDAAPFHWLNAGDFGEGLLNNADVMQVYQAAIEGVDLPPANSDLFAALNSSGYLGGWDPANHYYTNSGSAASFQAMFDGNDLTINTNCFGSGFLSVADVYVTYRRSLDPSLTWFKRYWTNGQFVAVATTNLAYNTNVPHLLASQSAGMVAPKISSNLDYRQASVNFSAGDAVVTANQTIQIPISAQVFGDYPLRVLGLNLTVVPLDGSPRITQPVSFAPVAGLGSPTISSTKGASSYSAAWLDSSISGFTGNTLIGTLTVTIPATANSQSAYAVHFDKASGSPNGLALFPKQTLTGLITLSSRTNSSYGDGISDSWRLRWFGTINNLLSSSNACPTGDGINNWKKFVAGVDPNTANDFPSVNSKSPVPSGYTTAIHWPSVSGKLYAIERSSTLFPGAWTAIATNSGTGTDMEFDDNAKGTVHFYRVRILP